MCVFLHVVYIYVYIYIHMHVYIQIYVYFYTCVKVKEVLSVKPPKCQILPKYNPMCKFGSSSYNLDTLIEFAFPRRLVRLAIIHIF